MIRENNHIFSNAFEKKKMWGPKWQVKDCNDQYEFFKSIKLIRFLFKLKMLNAKLMVKYMIKCVFPKSNFGCD